LGDPNPRGRKLFIMRTQTAKHLEVLVTDPGRLHELLDDAEAALRQMPQQFAGILVTRHDPRRYTLSLSATVPFGETREQILS
jgi:hypothetical protein